jgi:hypothetical protein
MDPGKKTYATAKATARATALRSIYFKHINYRKYDKIQNAIS